ncbi:PadR family transcriptional regulator [Salinibacterium sp. ZJ77]|uniref:PadR family transcriptional regulator n=1 Tax=Salinibacterium sp. ZJ77 TaxID=2708337 RepID=UPI0014234F07|nr:PadR family transcriptional regulator [Salinibacterium sp. ZJ77]
MTPPVFAHGHLRLYLLSLLAERPQHGYELIQALGERFGGTYVPSAGTIYPRLAKLQDEGLVTKETDGRRSVYAITDAGRAELESRRGELDGIETGVTDSVRRLADEVRSSVDDAMRSLRADLAAAARESRGTTTPERPAASESERSRSEARQRFHEADAALSTFRADLRSELRGAVSNGSLRADTVELLVRRLAEVSREVTASVRERGSD